MNSRDRKHTFWAYSVCNLSKNDARWLVETGELYDNLFHTLRDLKKANDTASFHERGRKFPYLEKLCSEKIIQIDVHVLNNPDFDQTYTNNCEEEAIRLRKEREALEEVVRQKRLREDFVKTKAHAEKLYQELDRHFDKGKTQ